MVVMPQAALPTGPKQPMIIEGKTKAGSDSALLRPGRFT